jgi:hypothetical protein
MYMWHKPFTKRGSEYGVRALCVYSRLLYRSKSTEVSTYSGCLTLSCSALVH